MCCLSRTKVGRLGKKDKLENNTMPITTTMLYVDVTKNYHVAIECWRKKLA